ncbi:MAG: YicC family protein [Acidobacteria bacterium]|nr:MAG: YicC family protein [Acidobacteriota bacterium]
MIRSMTGYSSVRTEEDGFSLSVSLKSTNHRFLDLQVRLPQGLEPLDPALRRMVKEQVARGHLEVVVGLDLGCLPKAAFDRALLGAYLEAFEQARKEFGLRAEPDLSALLRIPGVITTASGEMSEKDRARIRETVERMLVEALGRLNQMRAKEGEALERDLRSRLARLQTLGAAIAEHAANLPKLYQRRLESRLRTLLAEGPGGVALDSGRLAQEVAFLASHSDVSEELERFRSHLHQAAELMEEASDVGKRLDFLLQEMNREANTLLSKTTDVPEVGVEIARQAIEMKAEIEKLREQAQNIE